MKAQHSSCKFFEERQVALVFQIPLGNRAARIAGLAPDRLSATLHAGVIMFTGGAATRRCLLCASVRALIAACEAILL